MTTTTLQTSNPNNCPQARCGGKSFVLSGVIGGIGAEKLAAAFKQPFHGVSLDDLAKSMSV